MLKDIAIFMAGYFVGILSIALSMSGYENRRKHLYIKTEGMRNEIR